MHSHLGKTPAATRKAALEAIYASLTTHHPTEKFLIAEESTASTSERIHDVHH